MASTDLVPSRSRSLAKQERQEAVALRHEQLPAKCANVRVQAAAVVAHSGLTSVETLTALEIQAIKRHGSIIDERVRTIVDTYTGLVNAELARLALGE